MISREEFNKDQHSTEIKQYDYFENGRLKRRLIERILEPKRKGYYTGGAGSDDESYKYKLDSEGRIKVFYRIINGKEYKVARYSYE